MTDPRSQVGTAAEVGPLPAVLHLPSVMDGGAPLDERLGDFTADIRILPLIGMAALVGVISAYVALALVRLIGLFTHVFYYHDFSTTLVSPADNRLGLWAVAVPVVGGLLVGLMAR